MIKLSLLTGSVIAGIAFATGCWVGWKTTLKVIDSVNIRKEKSK